MERYTELGRERDVRRVRANDGTPRTWLAIGDLVQLAKREGVGIVVRRNGRRQLDTYNIPTVSGRQAILVDVTKGHCTYLGLIENTCAEVRTGAPGNRAHERAGADPQEETHTEPESGPSEADGADDVGEEGDASPPPATSGGG